MRVHTRCMTQCVCACVFDDADMNATDVYMQFQIGWIADPLFFGDYPAVMRASQPHLPKFKDAEKKLLTGSTDFLAINYYTSHFVAAAPPGAPKSQVARRTCSSSLACMAPHPCMPATVLVCVTAPSIPKALFDHVLVSTPKGAHRTSALKQPIQHRQISLPLLAPAVAAAV